MKCMWVGWTTDDSGQAAILKHAERYGLILNSLRNPAQLAAIRMVSRSADHQASFFAVYNMETTEIVAFYQNSADELYLLFEQFCDHFYAMSRNSSYMNFISSHSNNIHALEQLRSIKYKASSLSQFVKKMLTSLPFSCQSLSPSPYFDQSLFRYDEKLERKDDDISCPRILRCFLHIDNFKKLEPLKLWIKTLPLLNYLVYELHLISATDRHRPSTDHPIKFISRRQPHTLKFKIKPGPKDHKQQIMGVSACESSSGPEAGSLDGRTKKVSSFLFHPFLPLALSIQQTLFLQPSVNIHFRG
ncbi:light-mediated development protein DET1-like [Populus alba x Populus x berolinensis]|nr:light-mediated development protein DET1-like [Populus alba x Populus x berolinensis]